MKTPHTLTLGSIANVLFREMGRDAGIDYARRVSYRSAANGNSDMAREYAEAEAELRSLDLTALRNQSRATA